MFRRCLKVLDLYSFKEVSDDIYYLIKFKKVMEINIFIIHKNYLMNSPHYMKQNKIENARDINFG